MMAGLSARAYATSQSKGDEMLLKVGNEPRVHDQLTYDHWVESWQIFSESIIDTLDRPRGDAYREIVEGERAEIKKWCARLLNKLQGTEDPTAPRTILFSLPLEARP
jgi:hypothetical protein